jgi:hypothetical protein
LTSHGPGLPARILGITVAAVLLLGPVAVAQSPTGPPSSPAPSSANVPLPVPSAQTDPDLEALMPQSIDGRSLTIESRKGPDIFAGSDPATIRSLVDGLAAQGKTLADLSIAIAHDADYTIAITALRVPGVDAATLIGPVLGMAPPEEQIQQVPGVVAGKDVTVVTDSTGVQQLYPAGDILWIVRAVDPALTEIVTALP